jgi:hypothetical protein
MKMLIVFQIALFSYVEETQVFFERKPSIFEAGASSRMFSCENCVSFGKEHFLPPWTFKVEIGSVCFK